MIPILYEKTATPEQLQNSCGLGWLIECTRCEVTEERNGSFEAVFSYPITGALFSRIEEGAIFKAAANDTSAPQAFRIYKSSKPMNGSVNFYGEHISYDLNGLPVNGWNYSEKTAQQAMQEAFERCPIAHSFAAYSDITKPNSAKNGEPQKLRSFLGGTSGSAIDTYGGELEFDNFNVHLWEHRGKDRGVVIRYGKDLTDIKQETNIAACYTHLFPFAKKTDAASGDEEVTTLKEQILELVNPATVGHQKAMLRDFSGSFEEGEAITEAKLRDVAQNYIQSNDLASPQVNITLSFAALWKSAEYAELMRDQRVRLCDTVHVVFEKLGITATAKIVKTVYDSLTEQFKSISVGSVKQTFADTVDDMQKKTEAAEKKQEKQAAALENKIQAEETRATEAEKGLGLRITQTEGTLTLQIEGCAKNSDLAAYVTSESLELTLSSYAKSSDLDSYAKTSDLSVYVTSDSLTTTLSSYATNGSVTNQLKNYVTSSSLSTTLSSYAGTTGNSTSFSYTLTSTNFSLSADGATVFNVTKDGATLGKMTITDKLYFGGDQRYYISANYNDANYYINLPGLKIDNASGAVFSGKLSAPSGTIGGFTLGSSALFNGITSITDTSHAGVYLGTDGIRLGLGGAFNVDSSGVATITKGTIQVGGTDSGFTNYTKLTHTSLINNYSDEFGDYYYTETLKGYMRFVSKDAIMGYDEKNLLIHPVEGYNGYDLHSDSGAVGLSVGQNSHLAYFRINCNETSLNSWVNLYAYNVTLTAGTLGKLSGTWQGTSGYVLTSDEREKHDIEDLDDRYEELISSLRPVRFKYDNGTSDRYHTGFIAQELEEALASCGISQKEAAAIVTFEEETEEGEKTETKGIRYEELIAVLWAKVRKQDAGLQELKNRLGGKE